MPTAHDLGLLTLRTAVGGALIAHGAQKLFGWFGGTGLEGTADMFDTIGFRPGRQNAIAAGLGEAGGGALLVLGLATPAAGAAVAGTMAVASSMHASNGFFAQNGGYEYPAVLGVAAAGLALAGPGALSLDGASGHALNKAWMRLAVLTAPLAAVAVIRRRKAALAADALGS
jgi:putative oxidoreductase